MSGEPFEGRNGNDESRIRLRLLGGFRAERQGAEVPDSAWDRPRARTLVKLLAVEPSHQLHREQIVDILWPDLNPDSALASFRKTLHRARRALEPGLPGRGTVSCLQFSGDTLSLDTGRVEIDADRFESLAQAALGGESVEPYETALRAYGGDLLPEDRYEDWASARRETLIDLNIRLLTGLAHLLEQRGQCRQAIERLEDVLRRDPLREHVYRHLMRLYTALGNRTQALRQYQLCREALRNELGVEPEPETTALYEEIASGRLSSAELPQASQRSAPVPLPAAIRRLSQRELVGRERPLHLLAAELAAVRGRAEASADTASPPIVLIGGEAGVGKTRLAAEVARMAHGEGMLVLWGDTYHHEGEAPYVPFVEALQGYLSARPVAERERVAAAYPELVPLLPGLTSSDPTAAGSIENRNDEAGKLRLFRDMVRLLAELAHEQPVLLVLDDLHLADSATLHLLQHLARAAHIQPWLAVATYRDEDVEPGSGFDLLRMSLIRSSLCRHIDLLRLSRSNCAALIASLLPEGTVNDDLVDRIYALSLGNPFFVTELVETMRDRGLVLCGGRWELTVEEIEVPTGVRDLIASRTARLPQGARQLLMLAATAGMESRYDVLREASSFDDATLLDALDAALEAHILEERDNSFVFQHPLLRETIYERLSRARRLHLHRRLAAGLQALHPEDVAAIAYHYERADAPEAAEWLERAGDRAASIYAADAAVASYEAAQKRLDHDDLQGHLRICEKLGDVLLAAGRYGAAIVALDDAARIAQRLCDLETAGRMTAKIGRAHRGKGTADEGIARVQPMLQHLSPRGPSPALAALHLALTHLFLLTGRYGEMLEAALRAKEIAETVNEPEMAAEAQERHGAALNQVTRAHESRRILEDALPAIEATGNRDLLWRALYNLGYAAQATGDLEGRRRYAERALQVAEEVGNPDATALTLSGLGNVLMLLGRWREAGVYLDRGVALARTGESSHSLATALIMRGILALWEGEIETAQDLLQLALAIGEERKDRQTLERAQLHLADLDLLLGRAGDAIARLEPFAQAEDVDMTLLVRFALALTERGDGARAAPYAIRAVSQTRAGNTYNLPEALLALGAVRAREGRVDEAEELFCEALEVARSIPLPYVQGRLLYRIGRLSLDRGDHVEARQRLEDALSIFRQLGARLDAERTEMAMKEPALPVS